VGINRHYVKRVSFMYFGREGALILEGYSSILNILDREGTFRLKAFREKAFQRKGGKGPLWTREKGEEQS